MLTHSEFILLEEETVVGYEAMRGCREVMGKVEKERWDNSNTQMLESKARCQREINDKQERADAVTLFKSSQAYLGAHCFESCVEKHLK